MQTRYVPDTHLCHKHGEQKATQVWAIPPEQRQPDDAPVMSYLTLIQVTLGCNCTRSYGVKRAWINSELRMCASGGFVSPVNELSKTWPLVQEA